MPGMQVFLRSVQDIGIGGRAGNAQFQFVLLSPDLEGLEIWSEIAGAEAADGARASPTSPPTSSGPGW